MCEGRRLRTHPGVIRLGDEGDGACDNPFGEKTEISESKKKKATVRTREEYVLVQ